MALTHTKKVYIGSFIKARIRIRIRNTAYSTLQVLKSTVSVDDAKKKVFIQNFTLVYGWYGHKTMSRKIS
jgi:hypothetical protein